MGELAYRPGRFGGGGVNRGHRQPVQGDLIGEIVIPTLANVEARERFLSVLEPLVGVLSAAREHAGTLPGEFLAAFIRDIVNNVLPQARQILSECLEELNEALPGQTIASRSNGKRPWLAAEKLHKLGAAFGNRSTQRPDLDDAFFEKLEAGHVAFCPLCRGKIEGFIHTYWMVRQDRKSDHSSAKQWKRKWRTGVVQQAASLAASIKASGALEDDLWMLLNIGVSPDIIATLGAISASSPPPPRHSEAEGSQEAINTTVQTARGVGYGLGLLIPALDVFADAYKKADRRTNEGNARERRGSASDTDWLLKALAETYAIAGGSVAMRWDKRDKKKVEGPFARFLWMVWEVLPPAGRPGRPGTFARRAKDQILPHFSTRDFKRKRCPDCAQIALERAGRRAQMAK
jgi:hypothetical protein